MQFIVSEVTAQPYAIEADTVEAAIEAREKGQGTKLPNRTVTRTAMPRPPQQPQPSSSTG
jgi:hypothetical protein